MENQPHDHDLGLAHDLPRLIERRRVLQLLGVVGVATLVGCGSNAADTANKTTTSGSTTSTSDGATDCSEIPEETAGPFPGDGSNGPDALGESGIVRRDITTSFGSSRTVAEGVPLTIRLTILDPAGACGALGGAAVYVWHCSREGLYSLYSPGVENENYLRGVQEADANGRVTFTSIFPGAYAGRWPHIHFEVYPNLHAATGGGKVLRTSQIALPEETCNVVYAVAGYEQSVRNMTQTTLASDMVFGDDGAVHQLPTTSGRVDTSLTVALAVAV